MSEGKKISELSREELEQSYLNLLNEFNRALYQVRKLSIRVSNLEQDNASLEFDNQNMLSVIQKGQQQEQEKPKSKKKKKNKAKGE